MPRHLPEMEPEFSDNDSSLGFVMHRGLLDEFPGMVWVSNSDGECSYVNRAVIAFLGADPREEPRGWQQFVHPEDATRVEAFYCETVAARRPFKLEYRLRHCGGGYRWVIDCANPSHDSSGAFTGYIGFCHDVTADRAADAARREVEEEVQLLSLATRDMIWSWDGRTDRMAQNLAFSEALGAPPGPKNSSVAWWKERVHPADVDKALATFREAVAGGQTDVSHRYRFRLLDGSYAMLDDRVCFIRDEAGRILRVVGSMRDVTAAHEAEEAQRRLSRILEGTSDVVGMASADGVLLYLNEAGRALLGLSPDEPLDGFMATDFHPDWANAIICGEGIPTAMEAGRWAGETALLTRDGREIPVSQVLLSHLGRDGQVEFLSSIMRDITERKRQEVARIEWVNRYDAAIRASGQLLFDWNSQTNDITYAGDITRFLGYTACELAGGLDRLRELIHPEDLLRFDEEIARVTATRDPFRLTFRVHCKRGHIRHIDAKGYFFLDRRGRIGRMVGFFADITAHKEAQEALARAHESLEARVQERTAELARTYGVIGERALQQEAVAHLGQRALAGAPLDVLFAEAVELVRTTLKADRCAMLELDTEQEFFHVRGTSGWPESDYEKVPAGEASQAGYTLLIREPVIVDDMEQENRFQISAPVKRSGARSGISVMVQAGDKPIGVLSAMTLQKRVFTVDDSHFLRSVANVLTAAIDHHRAEESVRLAREQAEAANRAKSDFLSRMSHELRTPLNAILGFTQLLEIESPTENQAESIAHINRAGLHLLSLINEVLDIARIEAGRLALAPEPIEFGQFIGGVLDLIRPAASRQSLRLINDTASCAETMLFADRQRLQQVMLNLLSNAVKYNRPAGRITVSCEPAGSRLRILVTDTGWGLTPSQLERLFVPFERLGAEATDIEGTGIGLVLARRIVAALNGILGVESTLGEGSTFWVDIPFADSAGESVHPNSEDLESPRAAELPAVRKLLYVEDQDLNLRLVERILRNRSEFQLLTAMQGGMALELAREHRPHLILLDLNLPDIPGEEVLRRLMADPDLKSVPVLLVSADAVGERIDQLLALGAAGYIAKPYKVSEFLKAIEDALRKAEEIRS